MKKYILYTIAIISILFLIRCEKDENPDLLKTVFTNKVPELTTVVLSEITDTSAISGGIISNDGGSKIIANGVCWSIKENPTIYDYKTTDSLGNNSFISKLNNLKEFTLFYIRSYATNTIGTAYGNTLLLKTSSNIPKINTKSISNITDSSLICGGDISSDGGTEIIARGVCWSTLQNPSVNDNKTMDSIGIGSFISNPRGLTPNTTFYLKAYATNGVGTAYGEEKTFITLTSIPKLTTDTITSITYNSAITGGYIISTGGLPIIAKGVCWSSSPNPTTADNKTTDGIGATAYTSNITGLSPNVTYYVRAYATNSLGTAYGNELTFNTSTTLPVLTTNAITSITDSSAISGGNVSSDGGNAIIARGVCWSLLQNPSINNSHTTNGTSTGSFTSNIYNLMPGKTYYVKAYAATNIGIAYGNQVSFNTLATLPTLTTSAITSITSNSAISGGNITSDGGATITSRGVCWSTTPNPTLTNSFTTDGTGNGSFSSNITGLSYLTTYYVRSYAINSIGLAYGNELSFTTLNPGLITISTSSITSITQTSAVCGGNVTNDGGANVTERGVCWNINPNPTIANFKTMDGSGTGNYISNLTGLTPGTIFYIRAYATNFSGTSYGNELSFNSSMLTIGQNYQGGIVYYFLQSGDNGYNSNMQHGLIIAPNNQSVGMQWYNGNNITTGAIGTVIGTGNTNTNSIVASQGAGNYAAKLCYDLVLNSYNDWYLPSKDELYKACLNQGVISDFTGNTGYWSSTEVDSSYAIEQWINTCFPGSNKLKNTLYYVRAIRSF